MFYMRTAIVSLSIVLVGFFFFSHFIRVRVAYKSAGGLGSPGDRAKFEEILL